VHTHGEKKRKKEKENKIPAIRGRVPIFSGDVVAEATKQARNRRAKHPFVNTK